VGAYGICHCLLPTRATRFKEIFGWPRIAMNSVWMIQI
jgi:hypothetical protein